MKYLLHFTILADAKKEEEVGEINAKILAQFKPELGTMLSHRTEFIRPAEPEQ